MNDKYLNDILEKQAYIQQNMPKKDPFDKGIMRAIKSAKRSLAMDEEQDDKAMRNSILTFGEEMHKMPKTRGFIGNLAQVGHAMGPAIKTHDTYEDQAKAENKAMLQYAQSLRAAEEAKMANLEQQAYLREHADQQLNFQREQLAEQKAYHNLMGEAAKAKAYAKANEKGELYSKDLIKSNIKSLEAQKDQSIKAKARYDVLKNYGDVLFDAKQKGLTGTDVFAQLKRDLARYIYDDSVELTLNDMLKQAYISRTKELGGSNPSTVEVNLAFATIPGIEKNYEASLKQLARDTQESLAIIDNYNNYRDKMEHSQFQGIPDKIEYLEKIPAPAPAPAPAPKLTLDADGQAYILPYGEYDDYLTKDLKTKSQLEQEKLEKEQSEKEQSKKDSLFGIPRGRTPLFGRFRH